MSIPRCAICQTLVRAGEESSTCPECAQTYHATCWNELGGCATYGCGKAAPARKPAPPAHVGGGWGDEKKCPACDRTIASSLLRCACGARFPYADAISRAEWADIQARQRATSGSRMTLLLLFLFSLLGLPAPILGPIAGWYAFSHRRLLAGADGTYLAMGYGALALGLTQIVFMALLFAGL